MHGPDELQRALDALTEKYGGWTYDIPLPFDVWTKGNLGLPHTRLKRVVQIVNDLSIKRLSDTRILDLGCLEGVFSIEFARHGARAVGVEIREASYKKAVFCRDALGLDNLEIHQDDVRNISPEKYGRFDAILCSGILYHLEALEAIQLAKSMYEMVDRVVVIDTHVALSAQERFVHRGEEYWGSVYREHPDDSTAAEKEKKLWASADNATSFWFTRPSLLNILADAGFSSVYECFNPVHANYGQPGVEHHDRCTFVAIKGTACDLTTSPSANVLREKWQEGSLTYSVASVHAANSPSLLAALAARLKRRLW